MIEDKYNIDDYILFKNKYLNFWKYYNNIISSDVFKFAKIIGLNIKNDDRFILEVIENNKITKYYLDDKHFERKLTKDEIKEFEIKKASLKFNI